MKYIVIIFCAVVLFSCNSESKLEENEQLEKEIAQIYKTAADSVDFPLPETIWSPIFFETIDETADDLFIENLRNLNVVDNSLEIRIWIGFGLSPLKGYILKKDRADIWQYNYFDRGKSYELGSWNNEVFYLDEPRSGSEVLWEKLHKENILTLPDSTKLVGQALVLDGVSYVFEVLTPDSYRTYFYGNPKYQKWDEAKNVISIIEILEAELDLDWVYED